MTVPWPHGVALPAGRYLVRLHAQDARGRTLLRRAHTSGRLLFTVSHVAVKAAVVPERPQSVRRAHPVHEGDDPRLRRP